MNKNIAILIVCALCGCATQPIQNGIPNLVEVEKNVYRGGQPDSAGWKYLASLGVTNTVKLNEGSEFGAVEAGITVCAFPIDTYHQTLGSPSLELVTNAVNAITPFTFIHCTHGEDRTGLIVAAYRVWKEGWTKEDAEKEMFLKGFHPELVGLYRFWRKEVNE